MPARAALPKRWALEGVPERLGRQVWQHGLQHLGANRGGGGIVEIDGRTHGWEDSGEAAAWECLGMTTVALHTLYSKLHDILHLHRLVGEKRLAVALPDERSDVRVLDFH